MRLAIRWSILLLLLLVSSATRALPPGPVTPPPLLLPDLVATKAFVAKWVPPAELKQYEPITGEVENGQRVYLVCELENRGRAFRGTWQLGYYVDGQRVYSQAFGGMQAGQKRNPAAAYVPSLDGPRKYECRLDDGNRIRERNERNNVARFAFVVAPWSRELAVTLRPQETGNWCWAASGQMTMEYLGRNVPQCEQANAASNRTDCCQGARCPPVGTTCAFTGWPQYWRWGFTAQHTSSTALTFAQLTSEILGNRPVAFTWAWNGGGGHMMVAHGVKRAVGVEYVFQLNPGPPCVGDRRLITYAEYDARAGDHSHWDDYYDIRRTATGREIEPVAFSAPAEGEAAEGKPVDGKLSEGKPAEGRPEAGPGAAAEPGGPAPATDAPRAARPPVRPTAKAAAAASLQDLSVLARDPALRDLGLAAPGAAKRPVAGEPIGEYHVRLDELRLFESGDDPAKLLHATGAFLVPVVVGGEVKSGVTVASERGGYAMVAFGDERLTRAVTAQLPGAPGATPAGSRLVRIRALQLAFVARTEGKELLLVPVLDDARFGFEAGKAMPAAVVFERLAPAAREKSLDAPG